MALRPGEEEVLKGLLEEAFGIISMCEDSDAPEEFKIMLRNWMLKTHAMICPNHEDVVTELLRMYSASSN